MLVCFGLFGLLLYNSVVANVISCTYQCFPGVSFTSTPHNILSHWLLSHITIVETTISSKRGMNPVAMTIINPRRGTGLAGDLFTFILSIVLLWPVYLSMLLLEHLFPVLQTICFPAVCSFTYSQKDEIKALSQLYQEKGYKQCEYHIHAPQNNFIELNFTRFFGFRPQSSMTNRNLESARSPEFDSDACLPPEVVLKEKSEREEPFGRICKNSANSLTPQVFHSKLNFIKITYIWVENHSSGFTVTFDFHHYNNTCVQVCDERLCLSDHQLCNGQYDCTDQSDEQSCPPFSQSTGASRSSTNVDLIKAVAVIITVVLMPGLFIIICVVSPCRLRSRMWRPSRRTREQIVHSPLRPNSQTSEVVYVPSSGTPSTSQDKLLEHQISQVRENRIRERSIQTDTMLDLPPQIAISKDGEEGYIESQKHLMFKRIQCRDHVFRPPPNRTVHDRESPPPYYSNSASLENIDNSARIVRDANGCTRVSRCYSMSTSVSSANGLRTPQKLSEAKTHHRTLSTNTAGERTHTVSASSLSYTKQTVDEPPDYRGVFYSDTSDITRVSPHQDSNV